MLLAEEAMSEQQYGMFFTGALVGLGTRCEIEGDKLETEAAPSPEGSCQWFMLLVKGSP